MKNMENGISPDTMDWYEAKPIPGIPKRVSVIRAPEKSPGRDPPKMVTIGIRVFLNEW